MVFSRIRCHFCGARQPHRKQVTQFQCSACEATNFLDGKGNIVDTPVAVVAQSAPVPSAAQRPPREAPLFGSTYQPQEQVFCRTCQQNQHLYNETLANYLPDDDDPRYSEFEQRLPQFKAELEKRYPLVCTKCAPKAQQQIHHSDYYGMTQNAAKLCAETKSRGVRQIKGRRDDWTKRGARTILFVVDKAMWLGLLTQVAWHLYGGYIELHAGTESGFESEPTATSCAMRAVAARADAAWADAACHRLLGAYVWKSIVLATFLLPYNTGYRHWFDGTDRMEAVHGQKNYFVLQLIMLFVRYMAWHTMSTPAIVRTFERSQILAVHAFTAIFIPLLQLMAGRSIQPVKWKVRGSIMPDPSHKDVLSQSAGPEREQYVPKSSADNPFKLLQQDEPRPFGAARSMTQPLSPQRPYLSPPEDDIDAMDMDIEPPAKTAQRFASPRQDLQPTRSWSNQNNSSVLGLSDMRHQLSGMEQDTQRQQELVTQEQARLNYSPGSFAVSTNAAATAPLRPFSVPVPPAPMSQERRLRNPWALPKKPEPTPPPPLSQQKDFMARMRAGVTPVKLVSPEPADPDFQVQKGKLRLASDDKETGLEDRFNKFFGIDDGSPVRQSGSSGWFGGLMGR